MPSFRKASEPWNWKIGLPSSRAQVPALAEPQRSGWPWKGQRLPFSIKAKSMEPKSSGKSGLLAARRSHPSAMFRNPPTSSKRSQRPSTRLALDIVFANAGINGVWAPLNEIEPNEWDETIAVNLKGTFLTVKYAIPYLRRAGGGSIIITASVNGTRIFSNAGATAYACSKAAQVALAKMAALELAKDRIRVNVICPGLVGSNIETTKEKRHLDRAQEPMEFPAGKVPLTDGRPGKAGDIAELVLFLATHRRSGHITGTPLWIDGAESLLQG